jgi:predicted nucleotidyltransferase
MSLNKTEVLINKFTEWARTQPDVTALALVGSHARNAATETSDIDLVVITAQPNKYLMDLSWIRPFGRVDRHQIEDYGKLTSIRVWYEDGRKWYMG